LLPHAEKSKDPFHGFSVGLGQIAKPIFVDWNRDNNTDLVIGTLAGPVAYFQRLSDGSFAERVQARQQLQKNLIRACSLT
jgi:hypothetical protein